MRESNRDVYPTDATLALYPDIRPLLVNPVVDDAFARYEAASRTAKRQYHSLGRLSILLIAASAIFTIAEALVIPAYSGERVANGLMAMVAVAGMALQIYILLTGQKRKWLLNRFACERLRSIKFQAYALAESALDTADLEARVIAYSARELAELENELNAGMAMLEQFDPGAALRVPSRPDKPANTALGHVAMSAFRELRTSYQSRFAASEVHRLAGGQRYIVSLSDMLYLGGAALVIAALFMKLVFPAAITIGAWIDFLASATFIAGIANTILDHAGLSHHATSRFVQYRDAIAGLIPDGGADQSLRGLVEKMELLALQELREFCIDSRTVSYRM